MGILAWLIVGLIAGWLAGMLTGGGRGLLGNIVLGILGGLLGGFIGSAVFGWDMTGFNLPSILLATLGAVLLVAILRFIPGRQPLE
ncbi:MAG: GlsB/YeaQ/YmgE family stress response membrane protein [Chloroflexota bacterium]|nr:GlsB/YeaQ/YmgE family stress response membrane protein [Chloroflexota bacterium]